MQDLNDLYYFAVVVDHGGFAPAGRILNIPKSKLSRRIAALEDRLGARLVQRSTRRFSVTEIGRTFYTHCKAMLVEAEAAEEAVAISRSEPRGVVRMTCPVALLQARVVTDDMIALRTAAIAGIGMVHLPEMMVLEDLRSGLLVRVLPAWAPRPEIIHAVMPSKRCVLPAVRALIDFLAVRFRELDEE